MLTIAPTAYVPLDPEIYRTGVSEQIAGRRELTCQQTLEFAKFIAGGINALNSRELIELITKMQ